MNEDKLKELEEILEKTHSRESSIILSAGRVADLIKYVRQLEEEKANLLEALDKAKDITANWHDQGLYTKHSTEGGG